MLNHLAGDPSALDAAFREASASFFFPRATVLCKGEPLFRSQLARDLGCLLDVDDDVIAWSCLPCCLPVEGGQHVTDFLVDYGDGSSVLLDAVEEECDPSVTAAVARLGLDCRFVPRCEIERGFRLQNAKDMLRYAKCRTPLNDRVRLLAALDEAGTISVADTFSLFREVQPLIGISWLVLNRFIRADLEGAILGPETILRRFYR